MSDTIIVTPSTDGSNVSVSLSGPFFMEIGFSEIDISSTYLAVDSGGHSASVLVQAPTVTLGTGNLVDATRPRIVITIPSTQVVTDSNFTSRDEILTIISGTPTELDSQFLLDKSLTTSFYQVFDRVRTENWNTNNVPDAHRKIWSNTVISDLNSKTARNMTARMHNRYSLATRPVPKKQFNNKYIANI